MKIVDCFPYFNEKELLELRINLLYDHVDKFIICDADRTHSGKPKPFLCKDVIRELNLPQEKIRVVEVNLPEKSTNPWVSGTWVRERMQRNAASQFIENDDVCFVGDCDEIIDPKYIKYYASIAKEHPHNILRVPLVLLTGRADLRVYDENETPREWNAPYFCLKSHLQKYTLSDIREASSLQKSIDFADIFVTENNQIVESGWHFTWMGDLNRIKIKCSSFLHHDEVKVVDGYEAKINATDPLGRTDHVLKSYPINLLPTKIFELERVKNFLLPNLIELNQEELYNNSSPNLTEKYKLKMLYDQHGHEVLENFYDKGEELAYLLYEKYVLELKFKNKKTYNMMELGSNYSYYSMLFKKILEPSETFNLLLEPYPQHMEMGKEHFHVNNLRGVFLNEVIYNPNYKWNNLEFGCPSTTIDDLMIRYKIDELDVLHCDIDGTEIHALEGSRQSLQNKKIDLLFIMTHTLPHIMDEEYNNSLKGIPTYLHSKCKELLLNYGYNLLYDHPQCSLGSDGMLIFKK